MAEPAGALGQLAHDLAAPLCALEVVLAQSPNLSAGSLTLLSEAVERLRAILGAALAQDLASSSHVDANDAVR